MTLADEVDAILASMVGDRDGETYDHERDFVRLNRQQARVFRALSCGEWMTLEQLSDITGDPTTSVSARIRDLRKERFGGHTVERLHIERGLWAYRLVTG
jgi:hypothetical protein